MEPLRTAPDPQLPTEAEVEDHRVDHTPYRIWCEWCRRSRGLGEQRGRGAGAVHLIPVVAMDYFFLTKDSVDTRESLSRTGFARDPDGDARLEAAIVEGTIVKCIILKDLKSKCMFAWVVPQKGRDASGFVVDLLSSAIKWLGYSNVLLKSDNEPAVLSVLRDTLRAIRVEVGEAKEEHCLAYDSQANGAVENGIRNLRGMLRSIRGCLEDRLGKRFPVNHPILTWMVPHAAAIMTMRHRGSDGRTAWMRVRGRPFGLRRAGFAELCLFKLPTKGPRAHARGNVADRWERGLFLGYSHDANTYLYADHGGVHTARCLERLPFENRWNIDRIAAVTATPQALHTPADPRTVLRDPSAQVEQPQRADPITKVRKFKVTMVDLETHGYTEGCEQCAYILRYRAGRPGYGHSDACRQRVMNAVGQTPEGRVRLERLEERVDRALGEHVERHAQAENGAMPREELLDPHMALPPSGLSNGATGAEALESRPGSLPPLDDASGGETQDGGDATEMEIDNADVGGDVPMAHVDAINSAPRLFSRKRSNQSQSVRVGSSPCPVGAPKVQFADVPNIRIDNDVAVEDEVIALVSAMGGDSNSYRREVKQSLNRMVAEVFSPPRVVQMVKAMPSLRLIPGFSLDLTTVDEFDGLPWDFNDPAKRKRALDLVDHQKPMLVVGSPACKAHSSWQNLNNLRRDPGVVRRELVESQLHIDFVMEIYRRQHRAGRYVSVRHRIDGWCPEGGSSPMPIRSTRRGFRRSGQEGDGLPHELSATC